MSNTKQSTDELGELGDVDQVDASKNWRRVRSVRFNDDEWDLLLTRARECGMQRGRYIRETALGAVPRGLGDKRLLAQLARVGNNLNQLAKRANEGQSIPRSEIMECLAEVLAAAGKI